MSNDQPRRRRRSSISEHIQRVFQIDRLEKKRQSRNLHSDDDGNPESASGPEREALPKDPKREEAADDGAHARKSLHDGTGSSSFLYSSLNSQMPSSGTPGSSRPSVMAVVSKDGDTISPQMAQLANSDVNGMRDQICASPTWNKDTSRKEKRATKRLEAERREIEKRLQHLEEAQARLDHGIYERNSRRLTKKQPLGSSSRSSSVNADRPRSSSAFSSFFSGSRRSSRSRASSVDRSDLESSRRRSADSPSLRRKEIPSEAASRPPSLPLTLPERFGAAISRELASKHGTSLVLTNQVQRPLHTTAKSDDLRESWKMAEAWQRKNSGSEVDREVSGPTQDSEIDDQPMVENAVENNEAWRGVPAEEPSTDLDRELFTAALKHERKGPVVSGPPAGSSNPHDNSATGTILSSPRAATQTDGRQQLHPDPLFPRITTARQLQDLASLENAQGPFGSKGPQTSTSMQGTVTGNLSKMGRVEASPHSYQRVYKSSPLAANPTTTDDIDKKDKARIPGASTAQNLVHTSTVQPSRFSNQYQYEAYRGQSHLLVASVNTSQTAQSRSKEIPYSYNRQSLSGSLQLPVKNARRNRDNRPQPTASFGHGSQQRPGDAKKSPDPATSTPSRRLGGNAAVSENIPTRAITEDKAMPIITPDAKSNLPQKSLSQGRQVADEVPGRTSFHNGLNGAGHAHSRSSSPNSSQGECSDYDTADEEVPSSAKSDSGDTPTEPPATDDSVPVLQVPVATEESPVGQVDQRGGPTLARSGPMKTLRRRPVQKVKAPQKDQLVAKIFVICCQCRYWHDMPSEVYAKLACAEPPHVESRSGNSDPRRDLMFSPEPADHRSLPILKRMHPFGNAPAARRVPTATETRPSSLYQPSSLQCCWCGHSMGRSCCQGWTTIVQMRERHH